MADKQREDQARRIRLEQACCDLKSSLALFNEQHRDMSVGKNGPSTKNLQKSRNNNVFNFGEVLFGGGQAFLPLLTASFSWN
jgi:hypothetical protein